MAIDILMPALSPTMTEGKLAKWVKKTGDKISSGDVIAEIETDKATMEVEAVDEGTLGEILVPEGTEGVAVNAVIAKLLGEGEKPGAASAAPAPKKQEPPTPAPAAPAKEPPSSAPAKQEPPASKPPVQAQANGSRVIASPLAKRIAEQSKIDLSKVQGSGPHGRIVKADVEAAAKGGTATKAAAPSVGGGAAPKSSVDARGLADALKMKYDVVPNSGVRKVIARRLTEAKQTVPHFYLTLDCNLDELLALRSKMNAAVEGSKISVNDFVIRAAALALKKVPDANVYFTDEAILKFEHADVSVAVATDNGLITPVIKAAETKSLAQISKEMRDLGTRARAGKLKPEEYQGGTFSVSNLGMFGIKQFEAIINPPQACILAVGAGEQRAIVKDGKVEVATMMSCTLSVDHRAVDGALGAVYLQAFQALIENPFGLIS
ncbi:pyruvate dehydrogenase complex dihydrolipoamide acetyltransferase [Roseiterribacter gracilis]|uniref:Acetyltransferase component of pyruvate dehydrogenase complex n=1 Tax=Roseiterribacter gracilis TaxID=2812848 RepID=A0A8S8XA76_9PROT|nr:dihydrolipoyllysine-residue acetyltransferase component of pyruvate dehydrogenase complex [Rhodospirillales bacterium TMPK1]